VGGLLWVRMNTGPATGTHFVCYDGNGNVWNLVSATTGTETARYEYGPFGEPPRLSGPAARINPFRFSTKRTEDFTGLVLYEYRAYSLTSGRWLSRDPVEERGGALLVGFVWNNPTLRVDVKGLSGCCILLRPMAVRPMPTVPRVCQPTPRPTPPLPPPVPPPLPVPPNPSPRPGSPDAEEDPSRSEEPCPPPPPEKGGPPWTYGDSDCTPEEKKLLGRQMHAVCDQPRKCDKLTDCQEILRRIRINEECAELRLKIMMKCFRGGDAIHQREYQKVLETLERCRKQLQSVGYT